MNGTRNAQCRSEAERFWAMVDKQDGSGCWLWTGSGTMSGYGQFRVDRSCKVLAHRWAYQQATGSIPEGMVVDHVCRNRACVRADHLRVITQSQNMENRDPRGQGTSGVRGVTWHAGMGKWRVEATHDRVRYQGGFFNEIEDARAAALDLRNRLFTHNDSDRTHPLEAL